MKVCSGNQFGNNFNNGDEGLFQEKNRPRDDNKFMLKPGINTSKNDLRTANSGIAAQGTFYGEKVTTGSIYIERFTPYLKDKYGASDVSDVDSFTASTGQTYNSKEVASSLGSKIIGSPFVKTANGDVVIGKSGVYAVTCQCVFVAPSDYSVSDSVNRKFYVALMLNGEASVYTQSRGCGAADAYSVFYTGWFDAGDKVNVGFTLTYPYVYKGSVSTYWDLINTVPIADRINGHVRLVTADGKLYVYTPTGQYGIDEYPARDALSSYAFLCLPSINLYRLS